MKRLILAFLTILVLGSFSIASARMEKHEYVVKKGDTPADILFVLDVEYSIKAHQVLEWNPDMTLHYIYPGQKIIFYVKPSVQERMDRFEALFQKIGARQLTQQVIQKAVQQGNQEVLAQIEHFRKFIGNINANQAETKRLLQNLDFSFQKENQETKKLLDSLLNQQKKEFNFLWLILGGIILILIILSLGGFYLIRTKKKIPQAQIEFTLKGQRYVYYPMIDKDGKYISLRKNNQQSFKSLLDLRKSVRSSFGQNPALIKQEIKAGRLIKK